MTSLMNGVASFGQPGSVSGHHEGLSCSVVITTCDRPDHLQRCVQSVIAQSQRPDELIVVDDCSSSEATNAVTRLVEAQVSLRMHRLGQRSGAPAARNAGAALARGDVLMFLDDDDVWEAGKIETQMRQLADNPQIGWVYTGMLSVDDSDGGRVLHASRQHLSGLIWPDILFRNFVGPTSAVAVRRELFERVGGFDSDLPALQDYDLWLRLALAAPVVYDGAHNLRFATVTTAATRVSSGIDNYRHAHRKLARKYAIELGQLSVMERRRFHAQSNVLLMGKYLDQGAYLRGAAMFGLSLASYPPTLARLARAALARLRNAIDRKRLPSQ